MKKVSILPFAMLGLSMLSSCSGTNKNRGTSNMVATMEVKEPILGVCNNSRVIAILPFPGNAQIKAEAPISDEEIEKQLNDEVKFLQDKPDYSDKGMVNLIVNCKGQMVRCETSNKTKSAELDQQIVAVFDKLKKWKAATVQGDAVDTSVSYSFFIEEGKIIL